MKRLSNGSNPRLMTNFSSFRGLLLLDRPVELFFPLQGFFFLVLAAWRNYSFAIKVHLVGETAVPAFPHDSVQRGDQLGTG